MIIWSNIRYYILCENMVCNVTKGRANKPPTNREAYNKTSVIDSFTYIIKSEWSASNNFFIRQWQYDYYVFFFGLVKLMVLQSSPQHMAKFVIRRQPISALKFTGFLHLSAAIRHTCQFYLQKCWLRTIDTSQMVKKTSEFQQRQFTH